MKLKSNHLLKIWAFISLLLLTAYALAVRMKTGEAFFLILNSINILLFIAAVFFRKKIDSRIRWLFSTFEGMMVDTRQPVRIELKYDHEWKFGLFFITSTALCGVYIIVLSLWDIQSYSSLIKEDGLVEYASALFWFLAAIVLFFTMIRSNGSTYFHRYHKLFYSLILLFFIACAGEEISWGQRIFSIETPELLKTINVQDEMTLHNIGSISIFSNAFFLLTIFFFLGLPYIRARNTSIRSLIDYYALPTPNRFAIGTFLITLSVWIFVGVRFGTLGFHPFSFYAENYYTQMDDEIFECLAAYSFLSFSVMNSLKRPIPITAEGV